MPTYIVGGSQRTGTSMMMQALMAGGLEADYDPNRDRMNDQHGDEHYKPNAGGFYELRREKYQAIGFPRAHEGKLIKVLNEGILKIAPRDPADPYRIVFMRRDPEEMRQSWQAFFGPNSTHPVLRGTMGDVDDWCTMQPATKRDLRAIEWACVEQRMNDIVGTLRNRVDCDVQELWYREVVMEPALVFDMLAEAGWPIDPEKATAVIDPALCHMRREELAVGA